MEYHYKKWWKSQQVKILNIKKIKLEKLECILKLNYSFYGGLFFNFNFYITMTYFLSPHFSFFLCHKHSVIILKAHNESILFLKLVHNF
jgi:hypothetical protein